MQLLTIGSTGFQPKWRQKTYSDGMPVPKTRANKHDWPIATRFFLERNPHLKTIVTPIENGEYTNDVVTIRDVPLFVRTELDRRLKNPVWQQYFDIKPSVIIDEYIENCEETIEELCERGFDHITLPPVYSLILGSVDGTPAKHMSRDVKTVTMTQLSFADANETVRNSQFNAFPIQIAECDDTHPDLIQFVADIVDALHHVSVNIVETRYSNRCQLSFTQPISL